MRAMDFPTIDHRGPEFGRLGLEVIEGSKKVFQTKNPVVIYPSSGTGAWEAAIVNTLSPGDKVLMAETGHFATLWRNMAHAHGLEVEFLEGDWRHGANPPNESGTARRGSRLPDQGRDGCAQRDLDRSREPHRRNPPRDRHARHPALFLVDTISRPQSIPA